jgi:hypothetical protein
MTIGHLRPGVVYPCDPVVAAHPYPNAGKTYGPLQSVIGQGGTKG